ncbi:hypothetical protein EVAR_97300_1 [Eumeta japonica]|uniref:Uncharacterized protein n=1 Tax=Eumeta variegata TaxID=151549 RepID=A0A4C1XEJ7_EUMVA|nr:hypothetical protein EVAR_97300_1 [Eumeta japonica]
MRDDRARPRVVRRRHRHDSRNNGSNHCHLIRRGRIPDEKTPGHDATVSPPSRTHTHEKDCVWCGNHTPPGTDLPQMGPLTTPAARAPARALAQTGTAWEETIGQVGEDWKSLHQLCRRLTKAPAPVCLLFDKTEIRRYAAKDRAEILAEHLEEQFILHPASDSHPTAIRHAEVKHRIRELLSAPISPLPGDYYVSPMETIRTILRLLKRKAPGPDGIPTIAIKQLPRRAMVAMTRD